MTSALAQEPVPQAFQFAWTEAVATHRVLPYLGGAEQEWMVGFLQQLGQKIFPLSQSAKDIRYDASTAMNKQFAIAFRELDEFLQTLPPDRLSSLKQEYHIFLAQKAGKYESLVAAFPELIAKKRMFSVDQFLPEHMHTGHLSYMILGGAIGRLVQMLHINVFDPDNVITASYRGNSRGM